MANEKEYGGITQSVLQCLKQNLQQMGISLPPGNNGTVTYQGVKLAINYNPVDQKLSIQILEKPILIPESLIWQLLDSHIQKCAGQ